MALSAAQKKQLADDIAAGHRLQDATRFRGLDPADVAQWRRDSPREVQHARFRAREGNGDKATRLARLQAIRAQIAANLETVDGRIAEVEAETE